MQTSLRPSYAICRVRLPVCHRARQMLLGALFGTLTMLSAGTPTVFAAEPNVVLPAPTFDEPAGTSHRELAVLAGGCFWGVQGVFQHVRGVIEVVAGYSGGTAETAQYETVSTGTTGHAESVAIEFDPTKISYGRLLQIYFSVALDPTQVGGQGPDRGPQYRSAIFPTSPMQERVALHYIEQLQQTHQFSRPLTTRVSAYKGFYAAEAYHQNYLTLHPDDVYIAINDIPKVEHLQRLFPQVYLAKPVLVQLAGE